MGWLGLTPAEILRRSPVLAVVGCSTHPEKDAHEVPMVLQQRGFRIVPVHLTATEILGERAYASVLDVPEPIDTVVVFRPSPECAGVAAEAVAAGAKAVWLQLGLVSPEARRIATEAGVGYVEDACSMVVAAEHGIDHGIVHRPDHGIVHRPGHDARSHSAGPDVAPDAARRAVPPSTRPGGSPPGPATG